MFNNDADQDILVKNPSGSGITTYLINWLLQNAGTNDIILSVYKNTSYTEGSGSVSSISPHNKNISISDESPFSVIDITNAETITLGTLMGTIIIPAGQFVKLEFSSFGIFKIPENNTIHAKITASDDYNLVVDFIVQ